MFVQSSGLNHKYSMDLLNYGYSKATTAKEVGDCFSPVAFSHFSADMEFASVTVKVPSLCMLIAPEISTSQSIAKALKGPGLTCEEKIQTAVAAWETSSIYFPHKDEFLLDWLSSMLVKPPTKK